MLIAGPIILTVIFSLVFAMLVYASLSGIKTWNHNNSQPRLIVDTRVVTKRTSVHSHSDDDFHSTNYYVTFEVESGDRIEFEVRGEEYGMLAEGDKGKLTFQGTRYLGFERTI